VLLLLLPGPLLLCPQNELYLHNIDMLQLVMNNSCLSTASAAVRRLQRWPLDQHDAHQLLLTAAASQHADRLVDGLLLCQGVQQHLDAAHEAVITLLLAHESLIRQEVILQMLHYLQSL
jgi:hypothetical protein